MAPAHHRAAIKDAVSEFRTVGKQRTVNGFGSGSSGLEPNNPLDPFQKIR
jgi:hypothetical protein